jgi:hypothetical protein
MNNPRALSGVAFATLLLIALMMGANHVAARLAFNNGVDVATAVVFRSGVTVLVLVIILLVQRVPQHFTPRHKRMLPLIGLLVGVHYAMQGLRPRMGFGSDVGGRRTPWIVGGMATLATGGIAAASATALMASGASHPPPSNSRLIPSTAVRVTSPRPAPRQRPISRSAGVRSPSTTDPPVEPTLGAGKGVLQRRRIEPGSAPVT